MMLEERSHLLIRHESPAAGLCLAFSNGLSHLFVETYGFGTFRCERQQNFGRLILNGLGQLPNSFDRRNALRFSALRRFAG